MKRLIIALALILGLLLFARPTTADAPWKVLGERIFVSAGGSIEYPAGEPFFIYHGFGDVDPSVEIPGRSLFELEVDGIYQKPVFYNVYNYPVPDDVGRWKEQGWLFTFPEGMTGTHTFTGHWWMSCKVAVGFGIYTGSCGTPNEQVEVFTNSLVITFTP